MSTGCQKLSDPPPIGGHWSQVILRLVHGSNLSQLLIYISIPVCTGPIRVPHGLTATSLPVHDNEYILDYRCWNFCETANTTKVPVFVRVCRKSDVRSSSLVARLNCHGHVRRVAMFAEDCRVRLSMFWWRRGGTIFLCCHLTEYRPVRRDATD